MSRKDLYAAKARELSAVVAQAHDPLIRQALELARDSWLMLADLESEAKALTRWGTEVDLATPTAGLPRAQRP